MQCGLQRVFWPSPPQRRDCEVTVTMRLLLIMILAAALTAWSAPISHADSTAEDPMLFSGASDASAAVLISPDSFIVGDDESDVLRAYKTQGGPAPVAECDLRAFLNTDIKRPEADIEGAAAAGRRIYWITSHGRNADGDLRLGRRRFFATETILTSAGLYIRPVGVPCNTLLDEMLKTPGLSELGLQEAAGTVSSPDGIEAARVARLQAPVAAPRPDALGKKKPKNQKQKKGNVEKKNNRPDLAPKRMGLNIEGLAASPDGTMLYIGFRNPLVQGKTNGKRNALIVPLLNPAAVVEKGDSPRFDRPILMDLDRRGIRDMVYSPLHKKYFLIAGPYDEGYDFALYAWSGAAESAPNLIHQFQKDPLRFHPEGIAAFPDSPKLLLISDDGTLPVRVSDPSECLEGKQGSDGTCLNKHLKTPALRSFRATWYQP